MNSAEVLRPGCTRGASNQGVAWRLASSGVFVVGQEVFSVACLLFELALDVVLVWLVWHGVEEPGDLVDGFLHKGVSRRAIPADYWVLETLRIFAQLCIDNLGHVKSVVLIWRQVVQLDGSAPSAVQVLNISFPSGSSEFANA